jgi:glycosyltransferase involved in cell wall biosynthesis
MSLTVIIPTMGRPSLIETLQSVVRQLHTGDEAIVVSDGFIQEVGDICAAFGPEVRFLYTDVRTKNSGASQRDLGIAAAREGTHLMFLDDDDIYVCGALLTVRAAVERDEDAVFIFRMKYGEAAPQPGLVLWADPEIRLCNVGSPMLVVPKKGYLTPWARFDPTVHDYWWAHWLSVQRRIEFREDIIALIRPSRMDYLREGIS